MSRLQAGRPEAAAEIWDWREDGSGATRGPSSAKLRLRGAIQAVAGAAVGVGLYLFASRTVAFAAFGLAGLILLSALASPFGIYAALQRLFAATGYAAGRAMTWIVMVPLFYLFFLPFGLALRRGRRDRLKRYFEEGAETYWEPHAKITGTSRERQY